MDLKLIDFRSRGDCKAALSIIDRGIAALPSREPHDVAYVKCLGVRLLLWGSNDCFLSLPSSLLHALEHQHSFVIIYVSLSLPPHASSCLCTHFSAPSRTFHDDASNILFLAARFSSPQRLFHRRNGKSSDASFFCAFDDEPLAVAASLLHGSSASISNFVNESKCFFFRLFSRNIPHSPFVTCWMRSLASLLCEGGFAFNFPSKFFHVSWGFSIFSGENVWRLRKAWNCREVEEEFYHLETILSHKFYSATRHDELHSLKMGKNYNIAMKKLTMTTTM